MDSDVIGEGLGELEAVFFATVEEVLVEGEVVFVEFLNLAWLDVANDHVNILDSSFDKVLDGIVDQGAVPDREHGFLDNLGDR